MRRCARARARPARALGGQAPQRRPRGARGRRRLRARAGRAQPSRRRAARRSDRRRSRGASSGAAAARWSRASAGRRGRAAWSSRAARTSGSTRRCVLPTPEQARELELEVDPERLRREAAALHRHGRSRARSRSARAARPWCWCGYAPAAGLRPPDHHARGRRLRGADRGRRGWRRAHAVSSWPSGRRRRAPVRVRRIRPVAALAEEAPALLGVVGLARIERHRLLDGRDGRVAARPSGTAARPACRGWSAPGDRSRAPRAPPARARLPAAPATISRRSRRTRRWLFSSSGEMPGSAAMRARWRAPKSPGASELRAGDAETRERSRSPRARPARAPARARCAAASWRSESSAATSAPAAKPPTCAAPAMKGTTAPSRKVTASIV